MKKFYKLMKDRNEEEKRTGKASYGTIIDRYFNSMLLCNNIPEIDPDIFHNIKVGDICDYIDSEGNYHTREEYENDTTGEIYEEYADIYQFFLTDINYYGLQHLKELAEDNNDNSIILAWSEKLKMYVLLVTHAGTGWSYVPTNIALTEDYKESM